MRFWTTLFLLLILLNSAFACTNFLITKGATVDGSTMITYAADAHVLYGELYHRPAKSYPPGTMKDIYEWDTGDYLGQIKQALYTYKVVGNMNEHQVSIGETTFTGRRELQDSTGIMDYGSLMYIALERSKTAREAIKVMTDLVAEYGYYSTGESFSISDPEEVWIMEMIGKGPGNTGAVWVARRIPDGYICGHANQARIRQFPLNDKKNCLYAEDVIDVARELGYYEGTDADFSFADVYAPLDHGALRFCEARVWAMFKRAAPSQDFPADYVRGDATAEPLPLWIKPDQKLTALDLMAFMRDHFENTEFDMTKGIGAGPYSCPYRWRPLTWKLDTLKYFNERATSTQQTGFSFVAQARSWLPDPVGGILWFGVDDTYSTVYVPMFCSIMSAPNAYAVGTGDFGSFSWESAFWVFNWVSNYAYSRYSEMIVDIQKEQSALEAGFAADMKSISEAAASLHEQSPQLAVDYLTEYSHEQACKTITKWKELGQHLIWKYLDGNLKDEHGKVKHPGYPKSWYKRIVEESGEKFKYID